MTITPTGTGAYRLANPNQFASLPDSFLALAPDSDGLVFGRWISGGFVHFVRSDLSIARAAQLFVRQGIKKGACDFSQVPSL